MKVIQCFPMFFLDEDGRRVGGPISFKEIEYLLKKFAKSNSLGPNGWIMEFFFVVL